ncbi:hypothetical protein OsI_29921 [Oryza sativa Indica Group]|uniref:Uncharacterized protein n=1 Tax=Oryza sativa subsp. indica TaxID=39946 RepID=A2YX54_ORYSI|nr:hypothetical protein OsI_29921 [Oryza sativa Indica Group]
MRTSRAAAAAASLPLLLLVALLVAAEGRRHKDGSGDEEAKACDKGWECSGSRFCCNDTITDYFKAYQYEELFAHRNDRSLDHADGWINLYAQDQAKFFADFKDAYIKLVNTGASWRSA